MIYTTEDVSFQAGVSAARSKLLSSLGVLAHPTPEGQDNREETDFILASEIVKRGPKDTVSFTVEERVVPFEGYDLTEYNKGQHAYVQEMMKKVGEVRALEASKRVTEYKF